MQPRHRELAGAEPALEVELAAAQRQLGARVPDGGARAAEAVGHREHGAQRPVAAQAQLDGLAVLASGAEQQRAEQGAAERSAASATSPGADTARTPTVPSPDSARSSRSPSFGTAVAIRAS